MLIRSKVEKKEGLSCNQPAIAQYGNKQVVLAYKNIVVEAVSYLVAHQMQRVPNAYYDKTM